MLSDMIIYFTGTGNSRFVAERLSAALEDTLLDASVYIRPDKAAAFTERGDYIFVAPIYAAAPPLVFLDFIRRFRFPDGIRAYFVMTCAGSMGGAPLYCRRIAAKKGFIYGGTAMVEMPQNYVAYFRIHTAEENRAVVRTSIPVINRLADDIREGMDLFEPGLKAWERLLTPIVLKPYYKLFISAKAFYATESCVGCSRCLKVCPLNNITSRERKPVWGSRCTHCMGCINLCPVGAIEYGNKTRGKLRYHGPEAG